MCSAECTLCPNTADRKNSEILYPSGYYITTFWRACICACVYISARATDTVCVSNISSKALRTLRVFAYKCRVHVESVVMYYFGLGRR